MKKKAISLFLSLVMCLTLLPTAALAEGTTPATGVYTALNEDGTPDQTTYRNAASRETSGSTGTVSLTGYWDIPYTEGTALTVYYYNADMTTLTGRESQPITTARIDEAGHLWSVTLRGDVSDEEVWADLTCQKASDGEDNFVMTFKRTPGKGLYYSSLQGNGSNKYVPMDGLTLPPYVKRMDIALSYYNGTAYEPVKRVFLPVGSGFDVMWMNERVENASDNWYYLSAYDFSEGRLYYYTGDNYNAPDAEPTGFVTLNSHQLPSVAFYTSAEGKPGEDTYRMYTIMDNNTNTSEPYKDYAYSTTLYLRSTEDRFTFSGTGNTVTCSQKHYDRNGMENAYAPETEYTSYHVDIEPIDGGKTLKVTVYANDSDLLLWLRGLEYAAYVNLLAPDHTQIRLNDLSFQTTKYLPRHLFKEAAEKSNGITLSAGDFAADITCDAALTTAIANSKDSATLEVSNVTDKLSQGETGAIKAANASAEVQGAVDITLAYGGETQHELDGTATVSYPCELNLADGEPVPVYYVYTESGEEKAERIEAVYDAAAKCVTFSTTHFSRFVIVTVPTSGTSGSGSSSTPTYSVTAPTTDNGSVTVSPKNAKKGDTVTITVTPDEGYLLDSLTVTDKNGNALELKDLGNGKYSFKMPKGKVNVEAAFVEDTEPLPSFADVPANAYYYDAVLWAAKNGVTGGVDENHFAPNEPCSRAQLVTFLWRAAGQPEASGTSGMTDVSQNAYYADAVAWAFENGIVGGYGNGLFGSDDTITREQMAVILYRFAQATGMDTTQGGMSVREYQDFDNISDYAVAAIQWAVNAGIMQGNDGNLMPGQPCTRAQIVTMLYRLLGE